MNTLSEHPETVKHHTRRIAELNDILRTTFIAYFGEVYITSGVQMLGEKLVSETVEAVQSFDAFTKDCDPYGEHDFGQVILTDGTKIFWKIDYYDKSLQYGSEDPSDPNVTRRVLTIMRADEY